MSCFGSYLGVAPLGDGAHCPDTHTYGDDGLCHAGPGYSGTTPLVAPHCDNGGIWHSDTGTCVTEEAFQGETTGAQPHPENAEKAKACLEAGGWWSDTPPPAQCHDLPDTSGVPANAPFLASHWKTAAVVVLALGAAAGGVALWKKRNRR